MDEYLSKKQVVDLLRSMPNPYELLSLHTIAMAICFIEKEPAADVQPVDRWISCKDKMPEDSVEVLVYDTDCGIVIGWYDKEIGDFAADFISPLDAVTHWQPLPEPPKDGDSE